MQGTPAAEQLPDSPAAVWLDAMPPTVEGQLALDEALLDEAHAGRCTDVVVRTWMATEHVIVLGSSCRLEDEVDAEACRDLGVRVVRRPSGGGTVILGPGCLMWSVVTHHPSGAPPIERIHAAMLDPLAAALSAVAPREIVRRGQSDLAMGGADDERKVSGNALRVRRHGVLYHGTLLDSFDLDLMPRVLRHPPREPAYRGSRPHAAFLANLGLGRDRLDAAVRAAFHATARRGDWPRNAVERLVRERYADADWTRRL
jgi:lipoate-protein ligase A